MTLDDLLAALEPLRSRHGNSPVRMACGDVEDVLATTAPIAEIWLATSKPPVLAPKFRPKQVSPIAS